jgi:peptidoglycan/xylan/chitin deacetylase (PgdA/CDA1 family)
MNASPVPILLYHSVSESPPTWIAPFTVHPDVFAQHLKIIAAAGCHALTVSEMVDRLGAGDSLPDRVVVITLDDGFVDTADVVAPALAARGWPATLYVTTAALSGPGSTSTHRLPPAPMLGWTQLPGLELLGLEIGAHTQTHPALDILSDPAALEEIQGSKVRLEDALGHPVRTFAYPHGHHDRRVSALVQHAGFDSACAVKNALSSAGDDRFGLARLTVMASTSPPLLAAWVTGHGAPVSSSRRKLRTRAGRHYRRLAARWGSG